MTKDIFNNQEKTFKFMRVHEYDGTQRAHKNLFVYEKIDGGNCSVRKEEGIVTPYSRSRKLTQQDLNLFYFRNFFNWAYSVSELCNLPEDKIICGEWTHYGFGHICYNSEYMERFFLLNVFDRSTEKYLNPNKIDDFIDSLEISRHVIRLPILHQKSLDKKISDKLVQSKSDFYDGPKEGIVIHKYSDSFRQGLRMEKCYSPDFDEIDSTKTGIRRLITRRRLVKAAQNLKAYRKKLSFGDVVNAAVNDILRDYGGYKKKELFEEFNKTEIHSIFREKILPLFQIKIK